jgi:hypothetical protein
MKTEWFHRYDSLAGGLIFPALMGGVIVISFAATLAVVAILVWAAL